MKTTQHTPGPWKQEFQQYEDGAHICVADKSGNWISDCGKEGIPECEANARLIAAAPELLEICKLIEFETNSIQSYTDDNSNVEVILNYQQILTLRKAIHKAI